MLSNEVTFLIKLLKTKVSLRAQRGNHVKRIVIARSAVTWQSLKIKMHLSYEIATLRSQ